MGAPTTPAFTCRRERAGTRQNVVDPCLPASTRCSLEARRPRGSRALSQRQYGCRLPSRRPRARLGWFGLCRAALESRLGAHALRLLPDDPRELASPESFTAPSKPTLLVRGRPPRPWDDFGLGDRGRTPPTSLLLLLPIGSGVRWIPPECFCDTYAMVAPSWAPALRSRPGP